MGKEEKTLILINGLWKDVCLFESEKGELNQITKQTILALSSEIVYFVTNQNGCFENLVNAFSLTWFSVWSKIDLFMKYDSRMQNSIKVHLLSLETSMISKKLWSSQSCLTTFDNRG